MQSLKSTLRSFSKPDWSPEHWAEHDAKCAEAAKREREAMLSRRIESAGIPERYRSADLATCPPEVRDWASAEHNGGGLLLQGTFGSGKTHAACAVLLRKVPLAPCRFVTMERLLREIRGAYNGSETEERVISRYVNVRYLVIDDIGKERLTEWSLPILFDIVNQRYNRLKPTIITTNYTGADLLDKLTVNGDSTTAKAIVSRLATYNRVLLSDKDRRRANG